MVLLALWYYLFHYCIVQIERYRQYRTLTHVNAFYQKNLEYPAVTVCFIPYNYGEIFRNPNVSLLVTPETIFLECYYTANGKAKQCSYVQTKVQNEVQHEITELQFFYCYTVGDNNQINTSKTASWTREDTFTMILNKSAKPKLDPYEVRLSSLYS